MSVPVSPLLPENLWQPGPLSLRLAPDEVHVWRFSLDRTDVELARLAKTLSAEERGRAARFHFERDRRHFLAGRGLLRALLARYLDCEPAGLRFRYGPQGKPALRTTDPLRFNLAHSAGLALLAVSAGREVGVDLERVDETLPHEEIAKRFFSAREQAALSALPAELRAAAFFACWTRKEAYLKANGGGLSVELDSFDVALAPGEPARLLEVRGEAGGEQRWSLRALEPGSGYDGAVVAEGQSWRVCCFT
jgi:4'-phosphopantetheinyl transferase